MIEVYCEGILTCEIDQIHISRADLSCTFVPLDGTVVDFLPSKITFKEHRSDGTYRAIYCFDCWDFKINRSNQHHFQFRRLEITTTEQY